MYKPNEIYTSAKEGIKKGLQYIAIGGLGALMLGSTIANNTYGQEKPKEEFKFEVLKEKTDNKNHRYDVRVKNLKNGKKYHLFNVDYTDYSKIDFIVDVGDTLQFKSLDLDRPTTHFNIEDIISINGQKINK